MKKLVSIILVGMLCMSSFAEVVFANDNNVDVSDVCDENIIEYSDDYNSEEINGNSTIIEDDVLQSENIDDTEDLLIESGNMEILGNTTSEDFAPNNEEETPIYNYISEKNTVSIYKMDNTYYYVEIVDGEIKLKKTDENQTDEIEIDIPQNEEEEISLMSTGTLSHDKDLIISNAAKIIIKNEGSYKSVNENDGYKDKTGKFVSRGMSIGKLQWSSHWGRALPLLQTIVKANPSNAKSILGTTLYNEIANNSSDYWTYKARIATKDEKAKISKLLGTTEGKAAQDAFAAQDTKSYVNKGIKLGLTSGAALVYYADLRNQFGDTSDTIAKNAKKTAGSYEKVTLELLHKAALKKVSTTYHARRNTTYNYVESLNWEKNQQENSVDITKKDIRKKVISILYGGDGGYMSCDFDGYVKLRQKYGYRHEGIDFAYKKGANVYSLINGKVVNTGGPLNTIAIYDKTNEKTVIYLHPGSIKCTVGQEVKRGDLIATEGSKGAGAVHTHVEVRNGKQIKASISRDTNLVNENPYPYWKKVLFEGGNPVTPDDPVSVSPSYKTTNKFPTPISAYLLKRQTVYKSPNGNSSKGQIKNNVQCKIKEIYTNGYAKITCSGISGSAYVKMSAFTKGTGVKRSERVSSTQKVYRHSDLKTSMGEVYKSDSLKVVYESGNKAQIIYPLDAGGYKMGWIDKSKFVGNGGSLKKVSGISTPIKAYTISTGKTKTYESVDGKETGYIAGNTDLCTIKAVYTNSWVKVTYPTNKGSKTAYAKASAFAAAFKILGTTNTTSTQKVYRRSDLKDKLGEVNKSDSIKIIGESGSNLQIIYPLDAGGYKMGWIAASKVKPVVKNIKASSTNPIKVVKGQPLKTEYITVVAEYLGGAVKTLKRKLGLSAEDDEGYILKNVEFDEAGVYTSAVEYEENDTMATDSINVEVIEKEITDIKIKSLPYKLEYVEGDIFDTAGLSVEAVYNNGDTEIINDYDFVCDEEECDGALTLASENVYIFADAAECSFGINVIPKEIQTIEISTLPDKITYVQGQEFDSTGLVLTAKYNNGDEEDITADYTCSELDTNSIGLQNIDVSYEGQTTQLSVEVVAKQPTSISVSQMPNNTSVIEGTNDIDTTGMKLLVKYNDDSERIIEGGFNIVGFEPYAIGTQTLKVNYCGLETTMDITVKEKTLTELKIIEPAEKLEFVEGEELITSGLVIYGYYDNDDVDEITDYEISGYNATVGINTVTVSYQGLSVSYNVDVKEKQLTGIEITSLPTKTEYVEGEALDLTGLQVTAVYDNGEQIIIPENDYSIGGFGNTPGQHAVSVSYNGVAAVFDVTVNALNIETLSLVSKPNKLTYEMGEELDLNGTEISAKYTNGNIENVDISDCTISGYNKENAGVQTVVAEYRDTSVCFVVNVKNIVDTTAILKIGRAYGVRGANITVPANIVNNTGISKFKIDITYDKSLFSACEAVPTDLIKNGTFLTSVSSETDEYITQTIEWTGNEEITKNGNVFNLNLRISETVEFNSYPIEISYYKENTANKNGELIDLNCMEGLVTVEEGDAITRIVTAEQASVVAGGIINYNISLDNNAGLSSYKLNIVYDNTAMKLVNISSGRQFADFDVDYTDNDGTVTVTGLSNGISRQNGTLLKLEMKTRDDVADGNYPITLSYVADETYYLNNDTHENVILKTVDGEIAVSGYVLGDINGDGKVNNFDVMALVGYVNSDKALDTEHLLAADITGDGVVDYLDYASLSAYIIGLYENLDSDSETVGGSLSYKSNFVGGANHEKAVVVASEIFNAEIGEEVSMDFDLSRNPGMSGYVISLKYDTNALELIDIKQCEALSGGKFSVNTSIDGDTTVMWSDDSVHNENGTIFNAIFKVKSELTDESLVQIQYNSEHTGYIDEDFSPVPVDLMSESGAVYPSESNAYLTISDVVRGNTEISGKITLYGVDTMNENAQLYVASYDNSGALITVEAFDVKFDKGDCYDEEFKIKAEKINTIEKIKAFVWDRTDMHPLVKSKTYRP